MACTTNQTIVTVCVLLYSCTIEYLFYMYIDWKYRYSFLILILNVVSFIFSCWATAKAKYQEAVPSLPEEETFHQWTSEVYCIGTHWTLSVKILHRYHRWCLLTVYIQQRQSMCFMRPWIQETHTHIMGKSPEDDHTVVPQLPGHPLCTQILAF